jgi:serine/threonine protein kinase
VIPEGQSNVPGSGHSVLYRPPESFSTGLYDRRGDLYQCGIVLYQILGGWLPYAYHEYLTDQERESYKQLEDDFERSRMLTAVEKCGAWRATNPDPDQRFQSASDFMNKLNSIASKVVDWRCSGVEPIVNGGRKVRRLVETSGRSKTAARRVVFR